MRLSAFVLVLFVSLMLSLGCSFVSGSGRVVEETRTVPAFTAVEVDDAITATVTVGPAFSVLLRTDDNVAPMVSTTVEGSRLVLKLPSATNVSSDVGIHVVITMPALAEVVASGASHAFVTGVAAPTLAVRASGASGVTTSGTATQLDVVASGSSSVALDGTQVERATLDVSGSSDATVRASSSVRGQVTGASPLRMSTCAVRRPPVIWKRPARARSTSSLEPGEHRFVENLKLTAL